LCGFRRIVPKVGRTQTSSEADQRQLIPWMMGSVSCRGIHYPRRRQYLPPVMVMLDDGRIRCIPHIHPIAFLLQFPINSGGPLRATTALDIWHLAVTEFKMSSNCRVIFRAVAGFVNRQQPPRIGRALQALRAQERGDFILAKSEMLVRLLSQLLSTTA